MASHHVCQILLLISLLIAGVAGDFNKDFQITWGNGRAKILDGGQLLTLSLDRASGSGGQSRNQFLYGKFEVQLKLIPRNSAGTVTTYYLKSEGDQSWDEIDLEFLGNASGQPYTLHTNVFTKGKGNREQQFHLWFDPSQNFHTYSILWNSKRIILLVDGTPIREFKNMQSKGVLFPTSQPMRLYSTLWNADDWATQGGRVKTDWSLAPFTASYRNLVVNACNWSSGKSSCATATSGSSSSWMNEELNSAQQNKMSWAQKNYMVYNYCTDLKRFPQGLPKECV